MDLNRNAKIAHLAVAVATMVLGTGCELSDAFAPSREKYDGVPKSAVATPSETDAKLTMYLRCQDSLVDVLDDGWTRITQQLDASGKLRRRRRLYVYAVPYSIFRVCDQTLREGPEALPSMPQIEEAAEDMVASAKRFAELTRELEAYVGDDGLAKDDGAKVQVLYPLIVDAHEKWQRADKILTLNLNASKDTNDPELLAQLAFGGHDVEYHARAMIIHARQLVLCLSTEDEDAEECADEWRSFDDAFEEFDGFYGKERVRADQVFWMRTYAEDVKDFHALADDVVERAEKSKALRDADADAIVAAYRRLFRGANTLDFDFPAE